MAEERVPDSHVMGVHTAFAQRQLQDGALMGLTLEDLWRAAFAYGVNRGLGQDRPASCQLAARPGETAPERGQGWTYAPVELLGMDAGTRFSYGGLDAGKPNCERPAVLTSRAGSLALMLTDTGETVRVPAGAFWARRAASGG